MEDTKDKTKVFYLETNKSITFYSSKLDVKLEMPKTEDNRTAFNKILESNLYDFITLIK